MLGNHAKSRRSHSIGILLCTGGPFFFLACAANRPPATPAATASAASAPAQTLYESGQDREIVNRVAALPSGGAGSEDVWFAGHSDLRLGRRDEAAALFMRLNETSPNEAFRVAAQIELAILSGDGAAIDSARAAAAAFPSDPFVQYELGAAHAARNDFAAAAQAFDASFAAAPRFAYAYYEAGLAYERVGRLDLTVVRFENFLRLAPGAPERPQVEAILRTARGR
jgi:tetratricopeptide (TPR) repeat protein